MSLMLNDLTEIEETIGYTFKNKLYLAQVFNCYPGKTDAPNQPRPHELFAWLGESILSFNISDMLIRISSEIGRKFIPKVPAEKLANVRETLSVEKYLAKTFNTMNLAKYIQTPGIISTKIKAETFQALIGAIYLDSGNATDARHFVETFIEFATIAGAESLT